MTRHAGDQFVPRTPVVEIEGSGLLVAGVDFDQAPWPKHHTLELAAHHYITEHIVPRGSNVQRTAAAISEWMRALGPDIDITTIKREQGRAVVARVLGRGLKPATARRIISVGRAALHHERREERIKEVVEFADVPAGSPRIRWLTRDEHRTLILLPKKPRIQRFWLAAFATGGRSEAIEEAEWDQVDFTALTFNLAKPGVDYRNKRRATVPITEKFAERLWSWKQRAEDNYVIGLSLRGKVTCTWKECKANLVAIGIDEVGVARHVARHTVASWLLQGWPEQGIPPMPVFDVAKYLGDTVRMVEMTYGHVLPKHLARCAAALPS
jgi:integrase